MTMNAALPLCIVVLTVTGCVSDPCPDGWKQFEDYCYKTRDEIVSYSDAKQWCSDHGGDLVKINSQKENEFVLQLARMEIYSADQVWIGLELLESMDETEDFYWSDFSVPVYINWAPGEPNGGDAEPCAQMYVRGYEDRLPHKASGYWNDIACGVASSQPNGIVCKLLP